jgi:hypothetical protein
VKYPEIPSGAYLAVEVLSIFMVILDLNPKYLASFENAQQTEKCLILLVIR